MTQLLSAIANCCRIVSQRKNRIANFGSILVASCNLLSIANWNLSNYLLRVCFQLPIAVEMFHPRWVCVIQTGRQKSPARVFLLGACIFSFVKFSSCAQLLIFPYKICKPYPGLGGRPRLTLSALSSLAAPERFPRASTSKYWLEAISWSSNLFSLVNWNFSQIPNWQLLIFSRLPIAVEIFHPRWIEFFHSTLVANLWFVLNWQLKFYQIANCWFFADCQLLLKPFIQNELNCNLFAITNWNVYQILLKF